MPDDTAAGSLKISSEIARDVVSCVPGSMASGTLLFRRRDWDLMIGPQKETGEKAVERPALEAEAWVDRYGDFLFRQAFARVGRREVAEDLVQEVFLAAWKAREQYAGRASEKTWLMEILRHKIADYYRRRAPEVELGGGADLEEFERSQFEDGGWKGAHWGTGTAPRAWMLPWQNLERSEFWQAVGHCTEHMPPKVAQVFVLRDVDELETEEICSQLGIKTAHLFVLLHRARLAMRRCLELNWFRRRQPNRGRSR